MADSAEIVPTAPARSTSAPIIIGRRPTRSERTPVSGSASTVGSVHASPTADSAPGEFEIA